ncbi:MAG: hypothetical protein ABIF77_02080, partial [bacterium]
EVKLDYMATEEVPILGTVRRADRETSVIHDIYWGPLCEDGLVGQGLQFAIYFGIFLSFRRKYRLRKYGDTFATDILPVFGGLFAAYLGGGIAIDYRYFSFVQALFYTCAGIMDGYDPQSDPVTVRAMAEEKRLEQEAAEGAVVVL